MRTFAWLSLAAVIVGCIVIGVAAGIIVWTNTRPPTSGVEAIALCRDGSHAAVDAPRIDARLDALEHWGDVTVIDPTTVSIRFEVGALSPSMLRAVLLPARLELATLPDASPPYVCVAGPDACDGLRIPAATQVTGEDVERAEVIVDPDDGRPLVRITFTSDGARRFQELTAALVRHQLAIVLGGDVVSAPLVMQAISGGRADITMGNPVTANELAHALAASLGRPPLTCAHWEILSEGFFTAP